MTQELEDQLARVLRQRAETVTSAPAYRLVPDETPRRERIRLPRLPQINIAWAVAVTGVVAVVALIAALVVDTSGQGGVRPAVGGAICELGKSQQFGAAVSSGRLPAGSAVLAGAPDGSQLVAMQRSGVTDAVDFIAPDGTPTQLWKARSGQRIRAVANPSGAIANPYVSFVLKPLGSAATTVMVMRRDGSTAAVLHSDSGYHVVAGALAAPIAGTENVILLEAADADPARQKLLEFWETQWQRTFAGRVSGVSQMLSAGGNLVMPQRGRSGGVDLRFADPRYRPGTLEPAARNGYSFSSDGTTLTWLADDGGRQVLRQWRPGDPVPQSTRLPSGFTATAAHAGFAVGTGPHAIGRETAVDAATGHLSSLPQGMHLLRVDGPVAVVAQQSAAGTRYSRVPIDEFTSCPG